MSLRELILAALVPMALAMLCVLVLRPFAKHIGLVDHPNHRSNHHTPTPLIGGIAIAFALLLSVLTVSPWPANSYGLGIGIAMIFMVGVADDRFPIRARYRLAAQLIVGFGAVFMDGTLLTDLRDCFTAFDTSLGLLSVPFTIVCFAGLINAFNMTDGADGLCGGYTVSALVALLLAAWLVQLNSAGVAPAYQELSPIIVPAFGAVVGFLVFNMRFRRRAKAAVFLGDGGSMLLGFLIAWLCIRLAANYGDASVPAATILWIVALPLTDMFSCIARRVILDGVTPMTADNKHLHHLLIRKGLSARASVASLHLAAILCSAVGILGWWLGVPQFLMFWLLVMISLALHYYVTTFWKTSDSAVTARPVSLPEIQPREG